MLPSQSRNHTIMSNTFSPVQLQALSLLAQGQSITKTAQACELHRTTIHTWIRSNPDFADALRDARAENADHWRAEIQKHAESALNAVRALLDDPKTPATVRLKAALHILTLAAQPPAPQSKEERQDHHDLRVLQFREANPNYRTPSEALQEQMLRDHQDREQWLHEQRMEFLEKSIGEFQQSGSDSSQFITSTPESKPVESTKSKLEKTRPRNAA